MNEFLASVVGALNAIIAFVILGAGVLGALAALSQQNGVLLAVGCIVGALFAAVLVCGVLALVIDIRNSNREIVRLLQHGGGPR